MRAATVMTRDVVSIPSEATVFQAAERLIGSGVSAMPVVDGAGRMIGIISEADLMQRAELGTVPHKSWLSRVFSDSMTAANEYVALHARRVTDVMSKPVVTAQEDDSVEHVVDLMGKHGVKRIPIVRGDRVVGIVSRANLLRTFLSCDPRAAPSDVSDDQIRGEVEAVVGKKRWTSPWPTNVVVNAGVVHLWGFVPSDEVSEAYRVAAENVAGVKQVENHLRSLPTSVAMGV